jgi:hypothetical protein
MKLRQGDMFETPCDVLIVTTNSTIKNNGAVVMGRGAAQQARDTFSRCDLRFGNLIKHYHAGVYGLVWYSDLQGQILGAFQVKRHFKDTADIGLIVSAVDILKRLACTDWNRMTISLNFPGIGNGGLNRLDVEPLLYDLPNNVTVWEL